MFLLHNTIVVYIIRKKVREKSQSQTTALPRHQEEEETDKTKQAKIEQTYEKDWKHNNKITQGKARNKTPRRINHKATKNKTNTGATALERPVE